MFINAEILDIIDDLTPLLDTDGLWEFIETVTADDKFTSFNFPDIYTLSLVLMDMYDDDVDAIVNQLVSEGWHKWSHLDKFNHFRSKKWRDGVTTLYEGCISTLHGLPSSKDQGKFIPVDLDKYKTKIDFTSGNQDFRDKIGSPTLTLPIIAGTCRLDQVEKSLLDKLYLGYEVKESYPGSRKVMEPHSCIHFINNDRTAIVTGQMPIIYDLAKTYTRSCKRIEVDTLLPKEILEKYNLPMCQR